MQRRNFREKGQPTVMIIPMIDIMLFLLVFFMISTIYMVQTNTLQVNLPQSESTKIDTKPNVVPITVMENGNIMYDKDNINNRDLTIRVQKAILEDKDTVFVLFGDKFTKYEKVVSVLEMLKKSGVKHVSIATEIKK